MMILMTKIIVVMMKMITNVIFFYTLTDGQYGDYDEWRRNGGDIDSLMERLGY